MRCGVVVDSFECTARYAFDDTMYFYADSTGRLASRTDLSYHLHFIYYMCLYKPAHQDTSHQGEEGARGGYSGKTKRWTRGTPLILSGKRNYRCDENKKNDKSECSSVSRRGNSR